MTTSKKISNGLMYLVLILIAFIMILPFYEMFILSTQPTKAIFSFPPPFWFGHNLVANFQSMIASVNVPRAFLNSCIVSTSYTVLVLLFCSMGGYAFAVYDFPGKNFLFKFLLVTMMVPWTAGIIPWFFMMSKFGWINNYLALGIMQFVNTWNDFMQPLLILRSTAVQTLPLMLKYMLGDPTRGTDMGAMMLASSCSVLPLLIVFLCASKFFMSGLTAGAIKE